MKSKRKKRILAAVLCMVMVLTSNISLLAEDTGVVNTETPIESETPEQGQPESPETEEPEEPEQKPEVPEQKPEEPEVPEQKPEEPEQKPEVPEQKPEEPEQKPEVPEQKPEEPEQKPEVPEQKPEEPEQPVFSEAVEFTQEFRDANGELVQKITAKLPKGAFEAETSAITMEAEIVSGSSEEYMKQLIQKGIPQGKELGDCLLYKIDFKVNGKAMDSLEPIEITFAKSGFEVKDTKDVNVFYLEPKDLQAGRNEDEIVEIIQRKELVESLQASGKSTADLDEKYDVSSVEMKENQRTGKIVFEGRKSTIYGCYVEKEPEKEPEAPENKPEEPPVTPPTEAPELCYEDEQVVIKVTAEKEGVIPDNAELKVLPITADQETKGQYEEVEKKIQEKIAAEEKEVAGFLAYDISFVDKDGNEVEPNGKVKVSMNYKKAEIPKEVVEQEAKDAEVTVFHLEENEKGEVKNVVDMGANKTAKVDTLVTTEGQKVQNVEAETESFSVFAVTWEAQGAEARAGEYAYWYEAVWKEQGSPFSRPTARIYFVDERGRDLSETLGVGRYFEEEGIRGNSKKIEVSGTGSLNDNTEDKENLEEIGHRFSYNKTAYRFQGAHYKPNNEGEVITDLKYEHSGNIYWHYWSKSGNTWKNWDTNGYKREVEVYLVYKEDKNPPEATLGTVDTVDLTNSGISIRMTDHKTGANGVSLGGNYNNGKITQGLLENTLQNGYPVTKKGDSLEKAFSSETDLNGLFLQQVYDATGYYEYSSFDNYAYLDGNNFTVYDQRGTPKNDDKLFYQRGNFMPYNKIEADCYSINRNLYNENGEKLNSGEPGYNAPLYITQGKNNYQFGMCIEADFYQPKNGLVINDEEMCYEFNGDDDLWVFIDDVLVLDIGGIHDAHSGSINFSTGKVKVYDSATGGKPELVTDTTIKEQFIAAGKEAEFTGNTFKDYTKHTLKMFYMERGEGASNLHVKFNIETIPDGQVQIKKELNQTTDPILYGDVDFGFELYVEDMDPKTKEGLENFSKVTAGELSKYEAKLKDKTGNETDLTMDNNDRFYLKPKQTAIFNNIPVNRRYVVKEVDVKSAEFDHVEVNGVEIIEKEEDGDKHTFAVQTDPDTVEHRPVVVFINSCSSANLRTLQIEKNMRNNQESKDMFYMKLEIEGEDGKLHPYSGKYTVFDNASDTDGEDRNTKDTEGYIALQKDQIATIHNILSDTKFKVTEVELDKAKYEPPEYEIVTKTDKTKGNLESYEDGIEGTIYLNQDSKVIVTNSYKGTLSVEKVWKPSAPSDNSGVYVGVYEQQDDGTWKPVDGKYQLLNQENEWKHTFIGLDKEMSKYTVRELYATNGNEAGDFQINGTWYADVEEGGNVTFNGKNYTVTYDESNVGESKSVTITNTAAWQIIKVSKNSGANGEKLTLKGAEFTAQIMADGSGKSGTYYGRSEEGGVVKWYETHDFKKPLENLPSGNKYLILETKAPSGYLAGEYRWEIDLTGDVPIVKCNDSEMKAETVNGMITFYFENTPTYDLPSTGGNGIFQYIMSGTLLMIAAVLMLYKMKRKGVLES